MALSHWLRRLVFVTPNEQELSTLDTYEDALIEGAWEGRRLQVRWGRLRASILQDVAVTTHDFVNITAGEVDDTWVTGDFTTIEGLFDTFWAGIKPHWRAQTVLDQYRWYKIGPDIEPPQSPVRILEKDVAGESSGVLLPPQCAVSVTERTGVRKHWGRFYLPAPGDGVLDTTTGSLSAGHADLIASEAGDFYTGCNDADLLPVVYNRPRNAAFSVEKVQVDDLMDVIRSRRWKQPVTRAQRPAA